MQSRYNASARKKITRETIMKRRLLTFVCLLLILANLATILSACNTANNGDATEDVAATKESENTENTEATEEMSETREINCAIGAHDYVVVSKVDALALRDGEASYECSVCKDSYVEHLPATKSLKVLALGNSFTDDSTWHLWDICKDAGVEDLIVANLYVGNCTLNQHWENISTGKAVYTYRKTVSGTRIDTENYKFLDALEDEEWDFIVLHQTSGSAGLASNFVNLNSIIRIIESKKTNPDAKIIWHMPWAYQSDSTHAEFSKYDKDQMKMYETIVARVKEIILPKETIYDIIPSGTAIQNLRTSYVGDNVTRDGYHLDYGFGRYTAGLTWYAILTGGDVDAPDWVPAKYPEVKMYLSAIREAVKGALEENFKVSESSFKKPEEAFDLLSDYELLEWDYVTNGHWNCSASTAIVTPSSSDTTLYNTNICVDRMYSIDELPVGTVIVCDYGWRFRLEQFKTPSSKYTGSRHGGAVDVFFVLTDEFLNGCQYLAWSVSSNPRSDISDQFDEAYTHIRIYVPR